MTTAPRRLARAVAVFSLASIALSGCVERKQGEIPSTPTWVRHEIPKENTAERDFVMRTLQIGGHIECTRDGDRLEQTTEAYARVISRQGGFPAKVKKVRVQFKYMSGLLEGAITKKVATDSAWVAVQETVKIDHNGENECSCVRIHGKMWVLKKYSPLKITTICPEET